MPFRKVVEEKICVLDIVLVDGEVRDGVARIIIGFVVLAEGSLAFCVLRARIVFVLEFNCPGDAQEVEMAG